MARNRKVPVRGIIRRCRGKGGENRGLDKKEDRLGDLGLEKGRTGWMKSDRKERGKETAGMREW